MERILVGVDGSPASLKAVELAADLAKKCGAQLTLLTVVPRSPPAVEPAYEEYARIEHIREPPVDFAVAAAEKVLDTARRAAGAKGTMPIEAEPAFGDPAREIIAEAEDRNADLIVVGSRGHGQLAGLLLGSVAQKLVSHAPCPVLVVRWFPGAGGRLRVSVKGGHPAIPAKALEACGTADKIKVADAIRAMNLTTGPAAQCFPGPITFEEKGRRVDVPMIFAQWQQGVPVTIFPANLALAMAAWRSV